MLHPLYLWGPIGALVGWLGALAFYRASCRTGVGGAPSERPADDRCDELSTYLAQQSKMTIGLLCAAFVAGLLLYFLGAQPATLAPGFLLGGLCSAGGSYLGIKLAAAARHRFLQASTTEASEAWARARQASAAIGLTCHGSALVVLCIGVGATFALASHLPVEEAALRLTSFALGAGWQAFWIQLQALPLALAVRLRAASALPMTTASQALARQTALVGGRGAELFGSLVAAVLAATALAVTAALSIAPTDAAASARIAMLPVAVAGVGLLSSTVGLLLAQRRYTSERTWPGGDPGGALVASTALTAAGSAPLCAWAFQEFLLPNPGGWIGLWGCLGLGLATSLLAIALRKRASATDPNDSQAEPSLAQPLERLADTVCHSWPLAGLLAAAVLVAVKLSGGLEHPPLGLFGLALTAVAALGPLAAVMSREALLAITDQVDPTAKLEPAAMQGGGSTFVALGGAALVTLSLLALYTQQLRSVLIQITGNEPSFAAWGELALDEIQARAATHRALLGWYDAAVLNPLVLVAGLVGALIVVLVWSWGLRSAIGAPRHQTPESAESPPSSPTQGETSGGALTAALAEQVQSASWKAVLLTLLAPLLVSSLAGPAAAIGLVLGAVAATVTLGLTTCLSASHEAGPEPSNLELTGLLCALSKLLALLIALSAGAAVKLSPVVLRALGFF